jgi:hypothetical protein
MSRIIQVQGKVVFPPVCAVCLSPAQKRYIVERVFSYGRQGVAAQVEVPLCGAHYSLAVSKSRAEKLVGRLGLWLGALLGLLGAFGLVLYWADSGQGSLVPNLLLGLVVGAGFFLIVWTGALFWVAPRFANPQSLAVREAVRILRYWPGDQMLELEIRNEQAAQVYQEGLRAEVEPEEA